MNLFSTGRLAGLLAVLALAGCASGPPAPVEDRGAAAAPAAVPPSAASPVPDQDTSPAPPTGVTIFPLRDSTAAPVPEPAPGRPAAPAGEPPSAADPASSAPASPAVVALLNRANQEAAAGRHDTSAAALERAIKIEPGNAWLWHRLAQSRLAQGRPGEAASLAARSNSLAGANDRLQAQNWHLIARVHRSRGEDVAAREAERRARELGLPTS